MYHVAIMNKSWKLIPKILSGEKSIESRWYQTKRAPWDKVKPGDFIYFKNSGESVIAKAKVSRVWQFSIQRKFDVEGILKRFGKRICLVNPNPITWSRLPKYCILMELHEAKVIDRPWRVNKAGFGMGAAWLSTSVLAKIKITAREQLF